MAYKEVLLILCLIGVASAYNASVEPDLTTANDLLLNESMGSLGSLQSGAGSLVNVVLIVGFIIVFCVVLYSVASFLWGWIK
jgi:tetrahydromethanopterin S-methyltransferase subunit C